MSQIILQGRRLMPMRVTPDMAKVWLETKGFKNRRLTKRDVDTYARDMAAGNWRPTGEPICLDDNGNLLNGQTRMTALIQADVAVEMVILFGATAEDVAVMDSGRPRRAAQQLAMHTSMKHASLASAVIRIVVAWQIGSITNNHYRLSNSEVIQFANRYRVRLDESVTQALEVGKNTALSRPLVGAFAFVAYDHAVEHPEKFTADTVNAFLAALGSGAGLDENDPVLVLRNQAFRFQQQHRRETELVQLYRIVATWRSWLKGRRYSKLQLPSDPIAVTHLSLT